MELTIVEATAVKQVPVTHLRFERFLAKLEVAAEGIDANPPDDVEKVEVPESGRAIDERDSDLKERVIEGDVFVSEGSVVVHELPGHVATARVPVGGVADDATLELGLVGDSEDAVEGFLHVGGVKAVVVGEEDDGQSRAAVDEGYDLYGVEGRS
jgi:hypothetical protein